MTRDMNKRMVRIKNILKHNRLIYVLYYYLFSFALRLLGVFVRTDNKTVLFTSYGGKKYDDSPRFIYRYLLDKDEYSDLKLVWAFSDPENFPDVTNKVKIDTLKYFLTAIKAKYWITNSSCARGLNFKKNATINVFFTHGMTGIKKIGKDIENTNNTYRQLFKERFDYIFIEGKEETPILEKAWGVDAKQLYLTGLPRNDDLAVVSSEEIRKIKDRLGIPLEKRVILYAPTFREDYTDSENNNVLSIPLDFEKWEKALSDNYVLLITAHYEVEYLLNEIRSTQFVYNVFKYPVLNDLLKITDILITDYSSIVFDFSILEKPIFCYGYDYDEYLRNRGTYTDLNSLFSHGVLRTEEELINQIKNINYEEECKYTREKIKDRFIHSYGDAAEKAVNIIFSHKES